MVSGPWGKNDEVYFRRWCSLSWKKKLQRASYSREESHEPRGMTQAWHKFRSFTVIPIVISSRDGSGYLSFIRIFSVAWTYKRNFSCDETLLNTEVCEPFVVFFLSLS